MRACAGHATTAGVTTGTGEIAKSESAAEFARDWQHMRADHDLQFAPLDVPKAVRRQTG